MKAMRAASAMKAAMKAKKAMKASKIAKGKRAKAAVMQGKNEKTAGGLTKTDLTRNSRGKYVSKKKVAHGKKMFAKGLGKWNAAVKKARKELGLKGFVGVKKGSALHTKATQLYKQ